MRRRNFFKLAGAAAVGSMIARVALAAPPRPQNVLDPDAALARLMQGNKRYVDGDMHSHDFVAERPALVTGQNPFAGILSCSDSRIAPEYAFDTGRGDLFVVRVAGNFLSKDGLASFEYTTAVLGTPLLMVLGHDNCGAVDAAIKVVKDDAKLPGHIPLLAKAIRPAVKAVLDQPGDLLANAIRENVRLNVEKLKNASPILSERVSSGKLKVAGGVYNLTTGQIDLVG